MDKYVRIRRNLQRKVIRDWSATVAKPGTVVRDERVEVTSSETNLQVERGPGNAIRATMGKNRDGQAETKARRGQWGRRWTNQVPIGL